MAENQNAAEPSGGKSGIESFLDSCSEKVAQWKGRAPKTGIEPFAIELLENYIAVLRKYAVIEGRARRKEFWMFVLANLVVAFALGILSAIPVLGGLFRLVSSLFGLATIVPNFTVSVRRLHDRDKSGWVLLIMVIPFVLGIIGIVNFSLYGGWRSSFILFLFIIIISLVCNIILLVFLAMEGTHGSNKYGEDPKA
jgi:uncharacterized membrane protein YhaH (DUF805 family)